MDWDAILGTSNLVPMFNAGIRLATPIALAAVGETLCQRAGVLNLGLEGMMLAGALTSFLTTFTTGDPWLGALAGMTAGLVFAMVMAVVSVKVKTEQVVNGIIIVLLAQGATAFVYQRLFGINAEPPRFDPPSAIAIPGLERIPIVGDILFRQSPFFYLAVALILLVWWTLFRTRVGLWIRAVGEDPAAADAAGIRVDRIRWSAVLVSGALAGLGGAVLVVGQLGFFSENITAGRGWVAIALVIFGRWSPPRVAAGALLFGLADALQLRIQAAGGGIESPVPFEVFQALPYIVTILVVIVASARAKEDAQPRALGVPYVPESFD